MSKQQTQTFESFVRDTLKVRLTRAQLVLARVAFDGVEPGDLAGTDRDVAFQLFGDVSHIQPEARSVLVAVCGARSGKSYVFGALYSLWRALTANLSALAPGEHGVALIVAPDIRLARQCLRFALGAARSASSIARRIETETADGFTIRRPDGAVVSIEVLPATRGGSALRGRTLVSAVLDETAFFRDESSLVNDADIFRAVAPRVIRGGMVCVISTPWAESGLLFEEFTRNHESPVTAIAAHAPTTVMQPSKRTEVEREAERDPENARREFGAEFMSVGSGLFFDRATLDRAIVNVPTDGRGAILGGDLGLVRDASAFAAVAREGDFLDLVGLLEMRPSKAAPLKLSEVVARAVDFAKQHQAREIHVDHHSLPQARDLLPRGYAFEAIDGGQAAKLDRFVAVRTALNEGRIRIPARFRSVVNQLKEVISRPSPGGGLQISIPRRGGVHGDAAAAFVVAVSVAAQTEIRAETYGPRVWSNGGIDHAACGFDGAISHSGGGLHSDGYAPIRGGGLMSESDNYFTRQGMTRAA